MQYKPEEIGSEFTKEITDFLEEIMAQLIEDHRKCEKEFAVEHAQSEVEMTAEWKRKEEERKLRRGRGRGR